MRERGLLILTAASHLTHSLHQFLHPQRALDGLVFKHHEVAEIAQPPGVALPNFAQVQLVLAVRVVAVVALGFQQDGLARFGQHDEIRVVVKKTVEQEALAALKVARPALPVSP